jgi:hypothetical protein
MKSSNTRELECYVTDLIDALSRRDKPALRRFGQQEGFLHNSIRRLAWYEPITTKAGHVSSTVACLGTRYTVMRNLCFRKLMNGMRLLFIKTCGGRLRGSLVNPRPRATNVDLDDTRRMELENKLESALQKVLRIHPRLHYVQVFPP